jgi:hypothetical protein
MLGKEGEQVSAIKGVVSEEYQRLQQLRTKYEHELKKLPIGAMSIKKRGNSSYLYLAVRKGNRVIFNYIGSTSSDKADKIKKQIIIREKYRKILKKVKKDLKDVKGMLRERKTGTR